jgi:hypothetical protein
VKEEKSKDRRRERDRKKATMPGLLQDTEYINPGWLFFSHLCFYRDVFRRWFACMYNLGRIQMRAYLKLKARGRTQARRTQSLKKKYGYFSAIRPYDDDGGRVVKSN